MLFRRPYSRHATRCQAPTPKIALIGKDHQVLPKDCRESLPHRANLIRQDPYNIYGQVGATLHEFSIAVSTQVLYLGFRASLGGHRVRFFADSRREAEQGAGFSPGAQYLPTSHAHGERDAAAAHEEDPVWSGPLAEQNAICRNRKRLRALPHLIRQLIVRHRFVEQGGLWLFRVL